MSLQSGLKFEPSELCGQLPLNIVLKYFFFGGNPKPFPKSFDYNQSFGF
jgi:hypothetical protein